MYLLGLVLEWHPQIEKLMGLEIPLGYLLGLLLEFRLALRLALR